MCLYWLIHISYRLSTAFFHCRLRFFYCEESKQTLVLIWNVHISRIYHPNIKTCKTQLFVNREILPVLAYKPLEWKSQVMFWGICCSALWLEFWPHHTITDFEIAPPQLFQWQWSELFWCAHARFSSDRWSGLLICDNMLRGLLRGDMKSHFANSFSQLFASLPRCSWLMKKFTNRKSSSVCFKRASKAPASRIPSHNIKLSLTSFTLAPFTDCFSLLLASFPTLPGVFEMTFHEKVPIPIWSVTLQEVDLDSEH